MYIITYAIVFVIITKLPGPCSPVCGIQDMAVEGSITGRARCVSKDEW